MDIKLFMGRNMHNLFETWVVYQAFLDNIYCISFKLLLDNIKPMFQIVATHGYLANNCQFISPLGHTRCNPKP